MKRIAWLLAAALLACTAVAFAQEPGLELRLTRDFGSAIGSGNIRGTFSYRVNAPDDVTAVTFLLDDVPIAEVTETPWRYQFHTADFPDGVHTLSASGVTRDGRTLTSNSLTRNFMPAAAANRAILTIVAVIGALFLAVTLLSAWFSRRGLSDEAKAVSGAFGTAVCPFCGQPFARHLWAPNLGAGKLDRCPHCGKWNLVRRATPAEIERSLALLRKEEAKTAVDTPPPSDDLHKRLDDSRYDS